MDNIEKELIRLNKNMEKLSENLNNTEMNSSFLIKLGSLMVTTENALKVLFKKIGY